MTDNITVVNTVQSVTVTNTQPLVSVTTVGAQGPAGATGSAATIAAGSTTTGAAGTSATVTNSGTSSAAVFNFTIPQGIKGDTGNAGTNGTNGTNGTAATIAAGTTTTGAAGSSATVTNSGTSSAAVFNFTIPQGVQGATGATGATGSSGVITVNAPITNSGTSTAANLSVSAGTTSTAGILQLTDSTSSTSTTTAATPNAVKTAYDLAVTKAPIASPTFTGTVTIPTGSAITGVPYLASANTFTGGVQQITTANASTVGIIIKGAASQTANLQEWQNSAGTAVNYITAGGAQVNQSFQYIGGKLYVYGAADYGSALSVITPSTSTQGIIVRGLASQTANLQEWQNSSGTVLTSILAAGTINFASGNTSATANTGAVALPALAVGFITMQVAGTTVKVPYYAN